MRSLRMLEFALTVPLTFAWGRES